MECTTTVRSTDAAAQAVVTTFFMISSSPGPSSADWQALSDKMSSIFYATTGGGSYPWIQNGSRGGKTRVYNMSDPKPRPEKGFTSYTPASWEVSTLGPREVALCLSYYGLRNLPRQRGRIYTGPFVLSQIQERPDMTARQRTLSLGKTLIGPVVGGSVSDWSLVVWSRAAATPYAVTNLWCNDVWDVHRERGQPETTRDKYP